MTTIEDRQEQFNDVYETVFANLGRTKHQEAPRRSLQSPGTGRKQPDWLKEMCAEEDAREEAAWLKKFKGNLRTLDVLGLWRAAGLVIEQKDERSSMSSVPTERTTQTRKHGAGRSSISDLVNTPSSTAGEQSAGTVSSAPEKRCCPSVLSLWTNFVNHFILTAMMVVICPRSSRTTVNCPI